MTKTKLNTARLILAIVLIAALSSALCLVAFAEDAAATAQTRIYNEAFDRLLDDGKGEGFTPAYRSISWEAGQCDDPTDPIFKLGSPTISAGFETLQIVLRSPDESISLADLKIGFRVQNTDENAAQNSYVLTDAKIASAISLSGEAQDIGSEWTTLSIDLTQADLDTAIDTTQPDALLAYHLYTASNEVAGKLDIQKTSVVTRSNVTVVDNFDDEITKWWKDSEGGTYVDIPRGYVVDSSKQIVSDSEALNNLDGAYSAIVLKIAGSGTVTIAPVTADGVGTAKAWTALTDLEGTSVAALTDEYANVVISLESLGATAIKGVEIAVTGGTVNVAQVFFTNMESRDANKYFPALDVDSIAYLSQFDFEYLNADDDYDASVENCAQYNLWYALCYNKNPGTITNGHLVLNANKQEYTELKIRSKVASEGRRYLVIKYKLEDGATLNDFRFDVIKSDPDETLAKVTYANQLMAAFGLPSLSDVNPYNAGGDYEYMVVDLLETFGITDISGLHIYFSGEGQMLIDEIYYAHPQVNKTVLSKDDILSKALEIVVDDAGEYQYITGMDLDGKRHDGIQLVMRGEDAETTLDEIRIELGGKTLYFNNNSSLALDIYGREMPALTNENQVYAIDFAQSGVTGALENMHIHATPVDGGKKIIVESIKYIDYDLGEIKDNGESLAEPITKTSAKAGYDHVGGFEVVNVDFKKFAVMEVEVEGDVSELRIEMGGGIYWVKENDASLRDADGKLFDKTITTKRTLTIDLKQTGVTGDITAVHFHNDFAEAEQTLTVSSVKFKGYTSSVVSDELLPEPIEKEAAADYYYAGYIPAASAYIPQTLTLKVVGDLTNVRLQFGDEFRWFAENEQGILCGTDGTMFDLTEKDERTVVIDLVKSGIFYPIDGIHVHNNVNALTVSSAIYVSRPVGYENVVLPTNDDTKPVITHNIATTGKVGTEITLSATATDNYSENVTISYAVTLGTTAVTVTNGKFTPTEAGTYAVTITATDEADNTATETVSIVVAANQTTDPGTTTPTDPEQPSDSGLSTGAIVGIVLGCVAVVAVAAVAVFFVLKKKKASK